MEVISQREIYLKRVYDESRALWEKFVNDYNTGMSTKEIAKKYVNPKTGKHYSASHVNAVIKRMREEGTKE